MFSFFGSCLNNKNSTLNRESKLDDDIITNDEYQDIKLNKKDQLLFMFIQNKAQEAEKYLKQELDNAIEELEEETGGKNKWKRKI